MTRLQNLALLSSQLVNVLVYGGSSYETLSGRAYREGVLLGDPVWLERKKKIDALFFWDIEHCKKLYETGILNV
jgi:hypothetical protein